MGKVEIAQLFEAIMIILFGLSWPISIRKSWKSRTAKGKSLFFEVFLAIGYVFGISKFFINYSVLSEAGEKPSGLFYLAWVFFFINFISIMTDILLYFRNIKLDKARDAGELVDDIITEVAMEEAETEADEADEKLADAYARISELEEEVASLKAAKE